VLVVKRTSTSVKVVVFLGLGLLASCASPVEGAWEGKLELPKGSDPAGYEVHLTLSKFLVDEPGGAVEYTFFHLDGRRDQCSASLKGTSKEGAVYEYTERITAGKCDDGRVVRVSADGEERLDFQRLAADGSAELAVKLGVQTGIDTAKGTLDR
jgi:hypothetical protein